MGNGNRHGAGRRMLLRGMIEVHFPSVAGKRMGGGAAGNTGANNGHRFVARSRQRTVVPRRQSRLGLHTMRAQHMPFAPKTGHAFHRKSGLLQALTHHTRSGKRCGGTAAMA